MPTTAPRSVRELVPSGTHIARCIGFIHVGTYDDVNQNSEPDRKNEIRLTFEFPDILVPSRDGDNFPAILSQSYRLSMGEKANLRKIVEGIIGTSLDEEEAYGFDVESLVGMSCLITIKHKTSRKGNKYEQIASVSPLMQGQVAKDSPRAKKVLTYEKWDQEFFDNLPEFLRTLMASTDEYKKMIEGTKGQQA